MSVDEDQQWLDALGGRHRDGPAGGHREGSLLRNALQSKAAERRELVDAQPTPGAIDPQREQELIDRARKSGLLTSGGLGTADAPQHKRDFQPLWLAAAAGIAALVIGIGMQRPAQNSAPVTRTAADSIVHLKAHDPADLKQQILNALRSNGINAIGYESLGVQGIDAELSYPVTPEQSATLSRFGIPVPADGQLQIQIQESQ